MRLFRFIAAIAVLLVPASLAVAQQRPVVVELYTSQGCSSCPAADAYFAKLAQRDDVIALALHVDYWDYIGWKDIFAHPAFTARQRAYAEAAGDPMVYTPQIIVDGQQQMVGNRTRDIDALIRRNGARTPEVVVDLARSGEDVTISARARAGISGPLRVQLVHFVPERTVKITRGENKGKTVRYANIVTDWSELARWNPDEPLRLTVPTAGAGPMAVIVQRPGHGPILGAAALE